MIGMCSQTKHLDENAFCLKCYEKVQCSKLEQCEEVKSCVGKSAWIHFAS